jgi:hypothetical protein
MTFGFRGIMSEVCVGRKPLRAVLLGHSYVRRLGKFMTVDGSYSNLGLPSNQVEVNYVALGGATTCNGEKCVQQILHEVLSLPPTLIFLHLGENVVLNCDSSNLSELIADRIRRLLSIVAVQYIAISQ